MDTKKRLYKCATSDKFKKSPHYHKTIVDEKREMAENRTWICHHTNTEALLKIMSNKTFRFSRIDQVNDLSEKDLYSIDNLYMGTYIACFNHNQIESIPLWTMYTRRGSGIRIEMLFKEKGVHHFFNGIDFGSIEHDETIRGLGFEDFIPSIHDVFYANEFEVLPVFCDEDAILIDPQAFSFEKHTCWEYEEETRVTMLTLKTPLRETPRYIDFVLDFSKIKTITIVFDPWMTKEIKKSIELAVEYYMHGSECSVEFKDSELEGKIK